MKRPAKPKQAKAKNVKRSTKGKGSRAMAKSSTQKDPVQVFAPVAGTPGAAQPDVMLNAASQASMLSFTLNRKISVLMKARKRFVDALQLNPHRGWR
jgi:hypothetical protein